MISAPPCPLPREYHLKPWLIHVARIAGAAFIVLSILKLRHSMSPSDRDPLVVTLILELMAWALALFFILAPRKQKIILGVDGIELTGVLRRRRMAYEEIGARMFIFSLWPAWVILPKQRRARKLIIEVAYDFDKVYQDWFEAIPKADRSFFQSRRDRRPT